MHTKKIFNDVMMYGMLITIDADNTDKVPLAQ